MACWPLKTCITTRLRRRSTAYLPAIMAGLLFDKSVKVQDLAQGDAGVLNQTLPAMAAAVRGELAPDYAGWRDERIRQLAREVSFGMQDFCAVVGALFEYVRDAIPYRRDPSDTQIVQDAPATLGWRDGMPGGKCVDKVILLAALLRSLGYISRFVVQRHEQETGERLLDHVYLETFNPTSGEWIALDPTGDGFGARPIASVGWRNPAIEEIRFEIFSGEGNAMAQGLGEIWGDNIIGNPGSIYGPPSTPAPWWKEWGDRLIDVFGADRSDSPYISPDDPRYRGGGYYPGTFPGSVYTTRNQTGFVISNNMLMVGVALVAVYLLAKGRR